MEGLPRMPMLSVELKFCPASTDFGSKLKEYVAQFYQESPDAYSKEIEELNQLRENAIKAPADFTGCSTLKKYFAQLHLLKGRFPMEENDAAAVPFTWYEKFNDMPSPVTYEDIRYELACILHNIGSAHSYLATVDSRLTSEGMKVSCTHFQCAAWAFQILRDNPEPFRYSASSFSPDFDQNILDWYAVLMLAQAQECILEKSLVDNRKPHIIAKVAAQVSDYYAQAGRILEPSVVSDVVGSHKCKSWRKFVDMKRAFYRAIAYYEFGTQSDEQQKMGERLAYFQAAANDLTDAARYGQRDPSDSIHQSLQFAEDVIVGRLNQAKKENDFIYHEKIPSMDSLPELKGASLVKAIPFDPLDTDISSGDIFKRLIPLKVHQTSSLYSEEKAKLLRRIADEVEAKNLTLQEFMTSLKVDQLMLDVDFSQLPLPETLIERCAAFNANPSAVSDLFGQMSKLTNSYQGVEATVSEIGKTIDQSDKEAKKIMVQMYGVDDDQQPKVPNDVRASIIVRLKTFRDELDRYHRAHEQATKANMELQKALSAHSENLQLLSLPLAELKKQLPVPPTELADLPETKEMKRLLAKVDEMKRQRDMLMEQLRQQVRDDDVTKVLLAAKDKDEQEVFSKELKKHEKQVGVIEQNLAAQENIVKALTEANAKYSEVRKRTNTSTRHRDSKILNLIAAYDVYMDLESKSKEGLEFYEKLKKSLQELEVALSKWCEMELAAFRDKHKAELEKRAIAKAVSAVPASTGVIDPVGPKLKDYMAYYRAKKAGQAAAFPMAGANVPAPTSIFSAPHATAAANMSFPTSGYGGMSTVAGSDAMYPMTGCTINGSIPTNPPASIPPARLDGAYHGYQAPTFPVSGSHVPFSTSAYGNFPTTGINGAFPTTGTGGAYAVPSSTGAYSASGSSSGYSAGRVGGYSTPALAVGPSTAAGLSGTFPTPTVSGTMPAQPVSSQYYMTPQAVSGSFPAPMMSGMNAAMAASVNRPDMYASATTTPISAVTQASVPSSYVPYSTPGVVTSTGTPQHVAPVASTHIPGMTNATPQYAAPIASSAIPAAQIANFAPSSPAFVPGAATQAVPAAYGYSPIFLEPVASGSDYVQLRWRYNGPKPTKYMITFRGYQRYDNGMGRLEEREVDTGAPVKLDAEHYIVHSLRPDTTYAFEVSVVDETSGRIYVKSPTVRVNTNSSLL